MNAFGERRYAMDDLFNSGISIERMAAYLDGNLSAGEMQGISSLINSDAFLHQFMHASSVIDDALSDYSPDELELPSELQSLDFAFPDLDSDFIGLVTLSPEPRFEDVMAMASCANVPDVQHGSNEMGDSGTDIGDVVNDMPGENDSVDMGNDANSIEMDMDGL